MRQIDTRMQGVGKVEAAIIRGTLRLIAPGLATLPVIPAGGLLPYSVMDTARIAATPLPLSNR